MSRIMKDSTIPFAPRIPASWREIPNRYLFIEHSEKVGERWNEYQLLSLTTSGVKEKGVNETGGKVPESYSTYQTVEKGDMIFCLFDLDCSAVFSGLSGYNGMITSAYDVFKTNPQYLWNGYAKFWFEYVFSHRYYKMFSKNIRYSVTSDVFRGITTPIPPISEQQAIADFLEKKCSEIDELISLQEKFIEELKSYKQSVITEAVTKGLNPDVPMKDSGIEWIGEIPKEWGLQRLKFLCSIQTGNQDTQDADNNGVYPFYVRSPHIEKSNRYSFDGEGILMAGDGAGAGRVFHHVYGKYAVHQRVYRLALISEVNSNYLFYYLSNLFCREMDRGSAQSTVPSVRLPMLQNFMICIPSSDEQQEIADYLDKKCAEIDSLISLKQSKIEQLKEYKKSIIYEYVTGKKEVNG